MFRGVPCISTIVIKRETLRLNMFLNVQCIFAQAVGL